jgi:hypothetical protein
MHQTLARAGIGVAAVAVVHLVGCAVEAGRDTGRAEQSLSAGNLEDFESYAPGPLGAPWSISGGGSSTVSVASSADHGQVGVLHGGTSSADFAIASLAASSSDPVMHVELAVNPAPGASFVFSLQGAGGSIGARRIRLQRVAGSNMLAASTTGFGTQDCAPLPSGVWSTIGLDVRTDLHTFDVTLDGTPTACSAGATSIGVPFSGVSMMDASNEGFGGDVRFDDIAFTGAEAPPCTPPQTPPTTVLAANFDGDALGSLRAPWSVTQSTQRLSTASVVSASGHGRALQLHGSTRLGEFAIAARGFEAAQTDASFDFAVRPNSGASFIVAFKGAGGSIGARRIRLQRAPGSTALVANTAGVGDVTCGSLPSNAWANVSLRVHTQTIPHSFDVLINGVPSACTGTATELGTPFTGIDVMDASNSGWGGDVLFDDMSVTASGAPAGSCP